MYVATFTPPVDEGTVVVASGRRIGFARWGEYGPTVLCFHGGAGSRYLALGWDCAGAVGVQVVCLERPGLGLSDPDPSRTVRSWAADVGAVAGTLGLSRFAVVGVSAGAPYALVCGALLPQRVICVGVAAGVLPPEHYPDDEFVALAAADRAAARRAAVAREERRRTQGPVAPMHALGADGPVYDRPEVRQMFQSARAEAYRQGVDGAAEDAVLVNSPWGFDVSEVAVRLVWWHGDLDPVTPVATVRAVLGTVPNGTLITYPGEGHAVAITHAREILATLTKGLVAL
jgi:pimeloyl-ACP methyl ester carboxylesterase